MRGEPDVGAKAQGPAQASVHETEAPHLTFKWCFGFLLVLCFPTT